MKIMSYNKWQFNSMRQDAIRRSNEMYQKSAVSSDRAIQEDNNTKENNFHHKANPEIKESAGFNSASSCNFNMNNPLSVLSSKGLDAEKIIIIALIYLLIKEKADMKIVAALIYLLL
jgi:hypothetical protein